MTMSNWLTCLPNMLFFSCGKLVYTMVNLMNYALKCAIFRWAFFEPLKDREWSNRLWHSILMGDPMDLNSSSIKNGSKITPKKSTKKQPFTNSTSSRNLQHFLINAPNSSTWNHLRMIPPVGSPTATFLGNEERENSFSKPRCFSVPGRTEKWIFGWIRAPASPTNNWEYMEIS